MRESFIFHFEYLEDIPEELQSEYAMYVINYARYGEEPALDDWRDQKMWNQIKNRMDQETEKYNKKCRNLKNQNIQLEYKVPVEFENEQVEHVQIQDHDADAMLYQAYTNEADLEEKPKRKRFIKPTIEEVQAYCQERQNNVNVKRFFEHYNSNGWKVGKSGMKDWKAAVRYWETSDGPVRPNTGSAVKPQRQLPEDRLIF